MHYPSTHYPLFFFNDTATTEIYTLSLHDALPISPAAHRQGVRRARDRDSPLRLAPRSDSVPPGEIKDKGALCQRSEEHTSELQSPDHLVCRLLLEKKKECAHGLLRWLIVRGVMVG